MANTQAAAATDEMAQALGDGEDVEALLRQLQRRL